MKVEVASGEVFGVASFQLTAMKRSNHNAYFSAGLFPCICQYEVTVPIKDVLELLSLLQHPSVATCPFRIWEGGMDGGAETAVPNGRFKGFDKRFMQVETLELGQNTLCFTGRTMSQERIMTCDIKVSQCKMLRIIPRLLRATKKGPAGPPGMSKTVSPHGVITQKGQENPTVIMGLRPLSKPIVNLYDPSVSHLAFVHPLLRAFDIVPQVHFYMPKAGAWIYMLNLSPTTMVMTADEADRADEEREP